ncbi:MAG: tRNA nucleotidyltransferase [Clostridia bacterium]|nr:tRNA nucleotidyltransferase [Clostridia bacterium]
MTNIPIPAPVAKVLDVLHRAGYEAYIVGGCVRDCLMGRVPGDYDVTSSALPEECMAAFAGWRIVETGLKHGTVTVVSKQEDGTYYNVEITTFRIDGAYLDNRHPESVTFTRSLAEDVARRDFTVNAMAYSDPTGVIDLYDGRGDLERRIIRCVGDAEKRFREDGLRILRALRFSSVLDFTPAEDDGGAGRLSTHEAVHALRQLLTGISRERIHVELTKLLCGVGASRILRAYPDVIGTVLPMLTEERVYAAADALERLPAGGMPDVRYAALFAGCTEEQMREGIRSLKMSRAEERAIRGLWEHRCMIPAETDAPRYTLRKMAGEYGYDFCRRQAMLVCAVGGKDEDTLDRMLAAADALEAENPCCSLKELAVNGGDLQKYGITGQGIGKTLAALLDLVLRDEMPNEKEALCAKIQEV